MGVLALLHRQIWRESPDGRCCSWRFCSSISQPAYALHRTPAVAHARARSPSLVLAKQRWNVSEACRLLDDAAHPTHSTNLGQARSAAAAEEGAGVTARFGAAVRGGSAVTTRATPKIASPPPMSTTPVTGSDKITAPNNTATAGLT